MFQYRSENPNSITQDLEKNIRYLRKGSLKAVWEFVNHELSFLPTEKWEHRNERGKFGGSPVDFIKINFGNRDRENWDSRGLSITDLKSHPNLFVAYKKWIVKHPEDKLDLPASRHPFTRLPNHVYT